VFPETEKRSESTTIPFVSATPFFTINVCPGFVIIDIRTFRVSQTNQQMKKVKKNVSIILVINEF
jgi:hypothetical protein